jgi:hypothetical protein
VTSTSTASPTGAPGLLVGDAKEESQLDNNPAGVAEAFQSVASTSGTATQLLVYLDGSNAASQVAVGLYSNSTGNDPGTLLAQGLITGPAAGTWNTVSIPPTSVVAGTTYWIAILAPTGAGTVEFRDVPVGGKTETSAQSNLVSLPASWTSGGTYANAPLSGYVAAGP